MSFSGEIRFQCCYCDQSFISKLSLRTHMKDHTNQDYPDLNASTSTLIEELAPYVIIKPKKGRAELQPKTLRIVTESVSSSINVISTDNNRMVNNKDLELNSGTQLEHTLNTYMKRQIDENPLQCQLCGKGFKYQSQLKRHIMIRHNDERPFECQQCHKSFRLVKDLNIHMVRHIDERPFKCHRCSKSFKENWDLIQHRCNIVEKPFKCSYCNEGFKSCNYLNLHVRSHIDANPFICLLCGVTYKTRSLFNRHILNHSNNRPFQFKI